MKRLKILFIKVGLRAYNHSQYYPAMAFAILSGTLKKFCSSEVDTIHAIDGNIDYKSTEDIVATLDEYKPDVVGLSCFSFNQKLLEKFLLLIKAHNHSISTIVGGPHASLYYNSLIKNNNCDFIVIGEGEKTLCELIKTIAHGTNEFSKIKGIAYKDSNSAVITESRPFCNDLSGIYENIDHDCINYDNYDGLMNDLLTTGKNAVIMTSRGCPYQCAFCHGLMGKKVRRRTVKSVIDEIEFLVRNKNIKDYHIIDDIFNYDISWAKQFTKVLIERDFGINLFFQNGLRADLMDEELIDLLLEAGAREIRFAVETASTRLQKMIRKNLNLDKTMQIIKYADKTSAIIGAYFMMGFPSETKEELDHTISFVEETGIINPIINFLNISPNTPMEELYKKYAIDKKKLVTTVETGSSYRHINDNAYCYTPEYLKTKFQEISLKILGDSNMIAKTYKKLSDNLKETEVKIFYSVRYAIPNITNVRLNNLPDNDLGEYLKGIAKQSIPLAMKAFGFN